MPRSETPYMNGPAFPASVVGFEYVMDKVCGFSGLPFAENDMVCKVQWGYDSEAGRDIGVHYVHERFVNAHCRHTLWTQAALTSFEAQAEYLRGAPDRFGAHPAVLLIDHDGVQVYWDGTRAQWAKAVAAVHTYTTFRTTPEA